MKIIAIGALLTGGYSICYLLVLGHSLTSELLVTVLNVQPLLMLPATERVQSVRQMTSPVLALGDLSLVADEASVH